MSPLAKWLMAVLSLAGIGVLASLVAMLWVLSTYIG